MKGYSYYKNQIDTTFSKYIRQRDEDTCFTCGRKLDHKESQAGHYISRVNLALRCDEINVNCQCKGCNIFKKGNLTEYALRLMKKHGDYILYNLDYS